MKPYQTDNTDPIRRIKSKGTAALTVVGEIAIQALKDFPNAPTLTLAKKIYKENPYVYMSVEAARSTLRQHRGEHGDKSRRESLFFRENGKQEKITLPESWAKPMDIFTIPSGYKRIGILSDMQCPFHNVNAIEIAVEHLIKIGVDCVLLNGDILDCYQLSNFQKDPRKRNFAHEREAGIELLKWIKSKFAKIPVYYSLDANHEIRYERYMMIKAPEFFSTNLFHIEDLFMLHDIGIIPLKGYSHIMAGKLAILHGHTVFRGAVSPVSPARTVQMKLNQSALVSHVHKKSQYTWTTLDGETHSTWTTGCLSAIGTAVDYNPHGNFYVHGFAWVDIYADGMFAVENKMIVNGRVV